MTLPTHRDCLAAMDVCGKEEHIHKRLFKGKKLINNFNRKVILPCAFQNSPIRVHPSGECLKRTALLELLMVRGSIRYIEQSFTPQQKTWDGDTSRERKKYETL